MSFKRIILVLVIASALISAALATRGTATFYTEYVPSSCYGYDQQGLMIAAANPGLFNNKAACGMICTVQCTGSTNGAPGCNGGGPILVKIVDLCVGCDADQLDLSLDAFSAIGNTDAGKITTDYSC